MTTNKPLTDRELINRVQRSFNSEEIYRIKEMIEAGEEPDINAFFEGLNEGLDEVSHKDPLSVADKVQWDKEVEKTNKELAYIAELNRKKLEEIKERPSRKQLSNTFPYLPEYQYKWVRFVDDIGSPISQTEREKYVESSERVLCMLVDKWEFNPLPTTIKGIGTLKYVMSRDTVLMRKKKEQLDSSFNEQK